MLPEANINAMRLSNRRVGYNTLITNSINIGDRFGKLVVIDLNGPKRRTMYTVVCLCDCGNKANIYPANLLAKDKSCTRSCGCMQPGHPNFRKTKKQVIINVLIARYKYRAKDKNKEWSITDELAVNLLSSICYYCGKLRTLRYKNKLYRLNGIDRIDNNTGYTLSNSISCCSKCNEMKMDSSLDEFLFQIKNIYEHLNLGNYINISKMIG